MDSNRAGAALAAGLPVLLNPAYPLPNTALGRYDSVTLVGDRDEATAFHCSIRGGGGRADLSSTGSRKGRRSASRNPKHESCAEPCFLELTERDGRTPAERTSSIIASAPPECIRNHAVHWGTITVGLLALSCADDTAAASRAAPTRIADIQRTFLISVTISPRHRAELRAARPPPHQAAPTE
jgi:hypothetical protein